MSILCCVEVVKDGGCVLKRWMLCFVWGMIFFQAPVVDARDFLKEIEAHYSDGKIDDAPRGGARFCRGTCR